MEEENLFSGCWAGLDHLYGPVLKDSLGSDQFVGELDPYGSQRVLGSEVVVEESLVPDETSLSWQGGLPSDFVALLYVYKG